MKKKTSLFAVIFLFVLSANAWSSPVRERININREWRFYLGDAEGAEQPGYNDAEWTPTHLPHSFSIPYFMHTDVYHGYGWYRKTIAVGNDWKDRQIGIEFEGSFSLIRASNLSSLEIRCCFSKSAMRK